MTPTGLFASIPRFVGAVLVLALVSIPVSASQPAPKAAPYKLTGIQVKLFYDTKGAFSRDVLAAPEFAFWNTNIGEGDAEAPSNSTLVLVEITGEAGAAGIPARKLTLTATAGRRVLLNRTTEVGLFSAEGKYYAAFWLYDTGCQPIKLSSRIAGQSPASAKTATIAFSCGE
jgi:hypothetical protein